MRAIVLVAVSACTLSACKEDSKRTVEPEHEPITVDQGGVKSCGTSFQPELHFARRQTLHPAPSDPWIWHGGVTAADLSGDGVPDLLVATERGIELFETVGEAFVPRETLYDLDLTFASGTTTADYDGDGDLDLYVMRVAGAPAPEWTPENELGRNRLLRNDSGRFVDVTDAAGAPDGCGVHQRTGEYGCWRTMTSSWGDIDADGDLDLYVGNYGWVDETVTQEGMETGEPDLLYLNNGDSTFTDVSDRLPAAAVEGYTYAGGLFDLDHDGDLDLYIVNDFGRVSPNRVLWNEGDGTFVFQEKDPSGLDVKTTGMGLGVGDLNGDGRLDLMIPAWRENLLLESHPGIWAHAEYERGVQTPSRCVDPDADCQEVGWGTELGDIDNDGDLDALSQYGFLENENPAWPNVQVQPDALYVNEPTDTDGGYVLVDRGADWGLDHPGASRGAVLADLNRDGWLDIVKRSLDSDDPEKSVSPLHLSRCGTDAWLLVHLRQPGTLNGFAVGAEVTVEAGGRTFTRTLFGGGTGYASQPPPELHFGLGDVDVIDELVVRWPDGQQSVVRDLVTRQQVTLTR